MKCFKRRRAQKLTEANCTARMKRSKLLLILKKFSQFVADFIFFTDEKGVHCGFDDQEQHADK